MSFIQYLRFGVTVESNHFNRFSSAYQQDEAQPFQASHCYQGAITSSQNHQNALIRILDNAIQISTVSDNIRHSNLEFWNSRSVQSLVLGSISTLIGLSTGMAAGVLIEGAAITAAPVILGAMAITTISLAILSFYRTYQANQQLEAWQDPMPKYQQQRQTAGLQGFSYIFHHQLKDSVIHSQECKQLWLNWTEQKMTFYANLPIQSPSSKVLQDIKNFFNENPFDYKFLQYAFSNPQLISENIKKCSRSYYSMHAAYSDIRSEARKEKNKIDQEKTRLIENNDLERNKWLTPANTVKNTMIIEAANQKEDKIKAAKEAYNQAVQNINQNFAKKQLLSSEDALKKNHQLAEAKRIYQENPAVIEADKAYQSQYRKIELLYALATHPINHLFDSNRKKIEDEAQTQMTRVTQQENASISRFGSEIKRLAEIYNSGTLTDISQEINKNPLQELYPVMESINSFADIYSQTRPPAYNPEYTGSEWQQFYNQMVNLQPTAPL